MNTAILIASFGSTHPDTLEKSIIPVETAIAEAFPEYPCFRAFTSPTVRRRLKANLNLCVDSVEEALARLAQEGFEQVYLQPTLLLPGEEYDALCRTAESSPLRVEVGLPLLHDSRDISFMARTLIDTYPQPEDTVLLAMGHGTSHRADALYSRLRDYMNALGMELCTVEGSIDFAAAVENLSAMEQRKVHLVPLLLVAGEHSKNDMAGSQPDSLKSLLEQAGFTVTFTLQGLGELPSIRHKFVERIRQMQYNA